MLGPVVLEVELDVFLVPLLPQLGLQSTPVQVVARLTLLGEEETVMVRGPGLVRTHPTLGHYLPFSFVPQPIQSDMVGCRLLVLPEVLDQQRRHTRVDQSPRLRVERSADVPRRDRAGVSRVRIPLGGDEATNRERVEDRQSTVREPGDRDAQGIWSVTPVLYASAHIA